MFYAKRHVFAISFNFAIKLEGHIGQFLRFWILEDLVETFQDQSYTRLV